MDPSGKYPIIVHFRVHLSLYFKARLSAKSLLWKSVFIHIEIGTNYHNKNFALRLALKERLKRTRKWPIAVLAGIRWVNEILAWKRGWDFVSLVAAIVLHQKSDCMSHKSGEFFNISAILWSWSRLAWLHDGSRDCKHSIVAEVIRFWDGDTALISIWGEMHFRIDKKIRPLQW